jgi:hypothetical protein
VLKFKGVGQAQSRARGYTDLDELFIAHGFFADVDPMNNAWDAGETVGLAGYNAWRTPNGVDVPRRPVRRDVPEIPGSYLSFTANNVAGAPAPLKSMRIEVNFAPPFQHLSYAYSVAPHADGRVYYYAPDRHFATTTHFIPQADGYQALAPFAITNEAYWNAMDQGPAHHFAEHAFVLQETTRRLFLPMVVKGIRLGGQALDAPQLAGAAHTPRACVPEPRPTRTPTPTRTPGPPLVESVSPGSAPAGSGAQITIYGAFEPAALAFIGNAPLENLVFLGAESQPPHRLRLQGNLPASLAPGLYDVLVRNPDGKTGGLTAGFAVLEPATPTPSATATTEPTASATPSPTLTPTELSTLTPTLTPSTTWTTTATATDTVTATPTATPTSTPSATPAATWTPTVTASATWTLSPTPTRSATPTATPAGDWQILFSDGFEGAFPGPWDQYYEPTWGRTTCRKVAGSYAIWPAAVGTGAAVPCTENYPNDTISLIVAGPFDLTGASKAELTFQRWQRTELDSDFFAWLASWDGLNFEGWQSSGDSGGWKATTFDLKDYLGEPEVWIAFYFESDASGSDAGVWADDVVVRKK